MQEYEFHQHLPAHSVQGGMHVLNHTAHSFSVQSARLQAHILQDLGSLPCIWFNCTVTRHRVHSKILTARRSCPTRSAHALMRPLLGACSRGSSLTPSSTRPGYAHGVPFHVAAVSYLLLYLHTPRLLGDSICLRVGLKHQETSACCVQC